MSDAAVESRGLVIRYGSFEAVQDATFRVPLGSCYALLGPNGAGKTSIMRVLTTLIRPAGGEVRVLGHDPTTASSMIRRLIGHVPQALSADQWLSGRENLRLFAEIHHVPWNSRRTVVDEILELMGLTSVANELVSTYSGGMIRRLEIGSALLGSPRLLLLDEPTLGLDPIARRAVWEQLHTTRQTHGTTILATTHYLEEAEEHCDVVALMAEGRVLAEGAPSDLVSDLEGGGRLEDVFVAVAGTAPGERGGMRDVARVRKAARRLL